MGQKIGVDLQQLVQYEDHNLTPVRQLWKGIAFALASPQMNKLSINSPQSYHPIIVQLLESEIIPSVTDQRVSKPIVADFSFLDEIFRYDEVSSLRFEVDLVMGIYAKIFNQPFTPVREKSGRNRRTSTKQMIDECLNPLEKKFKAARRDVRQGTILHFSPAVFGMLPQALTNYATQDRNPELFETLLHTPALELTTTRSDSVGRQDKAYKYFRYFDIGSHFFNRFDFTPVIGGGIREQEPVIQRMQSIIEIPGVKTQAHLDEFAQSLGRRISTTDEYAALIIENAQSMSVDHFAALLEMLADNNIKVPYRSLDSAVERFNLPPEFLTRFKRFTETYHPQTFSTHAEGVEVKTTLENYLVRNLESIGFDKELQDIANALQSKGVVCVVDHTNYSGAKFKDGEYKTPTQRMNQELITGIIEGRVKGLEDYSVLSFSNLDLFMKALINYNRKNLPDEFKAFAMDDAIHIYKDLYDILDQARQYSGKVLFTIDGQEMDDPSAFGLVLDTIKRWNITTLISSKVALPGIPSVHLQPFTISDLERRLSEEQPRIEEHYGIKVTGDLLKQISSRVSMYTDQSQDPLFTALKVVQKACGAAKARDLNAVRNHELSGALANVFKQTDPGQTEAIEHTIIEYPQALKRTIRGQDDAITDITELMGAHIRGARVGNTPLAIFIPGPTGIGKTMLASVTGKHFSMPWLKLDFSQYTTREDTNRLVGSPPGYVGDSEGELSRFLRDHTSGIVFIDEYEKAASTVKLLCMNFVDKGTLTAGSGQVYERPGFIIMAASNAGAQALYRGTSPKDINQIVARALSDGDHVREELAARFHIIPMYPVSQEAFVQVIQDSLYELNNLPQFINDSTCVELVTREAVQHIYDLTEDTCRFRHKPISSIGFSTGEEKASGETYYNLREIPRQINKSLTKQVNLLHQIAAGRDKDTIGKFALDYRDGFLFEPL